MDAPIDDKGNEPASPNKTRLHGTASSYTYCQNGSCLCKVLGRSSWLTMMTQGPAPGLVRGPKPSRLTSP